MIVRAQCSPENADSGEVVVALRPELIELSVGEARHANQCLADVRGTAFLGDHYEYEVSFGGLSALVQHALPVAGATTLVTQCHRPNERNKVQAVNDFLVFGSMAIGSFASGKLLATYGWSMVAEVVLPSVGIAGILLIAVNLLTRPRAA